MFLVVRNVRYQVKGYLSVKEIAGKWGISVRWVNQYIWERRIPGYEKLGTVWAVPEDAVKPEKLPTGPKPQKVSCRPEGRQRSKRTRIYFCPLVSEY